MRNPGTLAGTGAERNSTQPYTTSRRAPQDRTEYDDGAQCGFLQRFDRERESGGAFRGWPLDRRNAWWCGAN
jgi:hypothetical protein